MVRYLGLIALPISELTPMARPPEKVFWSDEEKLAIVMREIELRMQ
jgi:hypothetical protein